mmetsp:Transcript_9289/g.56564  ORF Transcript_9289/g.56564 Transcript_9289/m.56564 type:complete len:80 (-) Transcript_9289:2045-2284(-)
MELVHKQDGILASGGWCAAWKWESIGTYKLWTLKSWHAAHTKSTTGMKRMPASCLENTHAYWYCQILLQQSSPVEDRGA